MIIINYNYNNNSYINKFIDIYLWNCRLYCYNNINLIYKDFVVSFFLRAFEIFTFSYLRICSYSLSWQLLLCPLLYLLLFTSSLPPFYPHIFSYTFLSSYLLFFYSLFSFFFLFFFYSFFSLPFFFFTFFFFLGRGWYRRGVTKY